MATQIRLGSVVPHGVGGPQAGAIDLIYYFLLNEHSQNPHSYIFINQIGDDLDEVIIKKGKEIYINIRYPAPDDFESKNEDEQNRIRLDVIHLALLRIAAKEKKLNIQILETLKNRILENNFSFYFVFKTFINKKNNDLIAKLVIHPNPDAFEYFIHIEEQGKLKCKLPIYNGFTNIIYVADLFWFGKWKNDNDFVLTGKKKEIEIHIKVDSCKVKYVNLTAYEKAPRFEMFRSDISPEERETARKDWEHSLPPAIAAFIRDANN